MQYIDIAINRYSDTSITFGNNCNNEHSIYNIETRHFCFVRSSDLLVKEKILADKHTFQHPQYYTADSGTWDRNMSKRSAFFPGMASTTSPMLANKCLNVPRRELPRLKKNKEREKD
jgi:hypothetical protein